VLFGHDFGQSSCQCGFAVINVANGAYVDMRFIEFKFFFGHGNYPLSQYFNQFVKKRRSYY